MVATMKSNLDAEGERVVRLFEEELPRYGFDQVDWSAWQDHEGVHIRLSAARQDDEPLRIDAFSLGVNRIPDYEITDAIRHYLRFLQERGSDSE